MIIFSPLDTLLGVGAAFLSAAVPAQRATSFWPGVITIAQNKASEYRLKLPKDLTGFANSGAQIDPKAAAALVAQLQGLAAEAETGIRSIETKANTIMGFLGGGIGIVALFTGSRTDTVIAAPVTLLAAILSYIAALVVAIRCLYAYRKRGIPELDKIQRQVESGGFTEGTFYAYLARSWQIRYSDFRVTSARKAQLIEATQILFAAGTLWVVLSFCISTVTLDKPVSVKPSFLKCVAD